MSKIPITGKLRPKEIHCHYAGSHKKLKVAPDIFGSTVPLQNSNITSEKIQKDQEFCKNPNLEKVTLEKSRILDLREKLNEIAKNQENNVDKKTKGLINNITQQLGDDKDQDESGPYSLLFDLHSDPSTSSKDTRETQLWNVFEVDKDNEMCAQTFNNLINPVNRSLDKLPNVINLENKPMREFEYSCESDVNFPVKKTFNTHSRSDLCLQLKSHLNLRTFETTLSPNDNSLNRTNDENSLDDSLGILTPDQMDDICYLENTFSPTVEGLPIFCDNSESKISPENGDSPSTDKTESNSAASTIQNDGFDKNNTKLFEFKTGLAPIASVESSTCNDPTIFTLFDNVESTNKDYETSFESVQLSTNNVIVPLIKTNESAQDDGFDVLKEEFIPSLIDEEFLPSIHSSILEPISSIAETTNNLDLPLNCKNDNLVVHRIEQTPSPEDLPLDSSDINGEISTYSQFSSSTLHESQTYSDPKNEYPKSMETSKVSNSFITSITSITSLDGYQGDGEMSRPVSRGADQSMEPREDAIEMDWQNVPVTRRADPMTDSDFFTESDADGLDDNMQRGDRRAQVIDGALYGGKNVNGNPLIVNRNDDSCMESSGVYTDFENQRGSPVFLNVIDDMSPEGSTISTHSECSQKNASNVSVGRHFSPSDDTREQNLPNTLEDSSLKINSKRNSLKSEKDLKCNEKTKEEKRSFTLKKYKMPKRDVPSKLKTMLASRKTDGDASTQSSPKVVKAPGRDILIKKNPLDLKTDYKAKSFKDIKSKVDVSFSLQRSQTSCSVSRMLTSKSTNTNAKPKSRHIRMRMDLASTNGSGKSSLHSSQSDVSATSSPLGKHTSSRFPAIRNGKKRDGVQTPTTPARPQPTPPQPPTAQAKKNGVVQKLSFSPVALRARTSLVPPPSPRKPTPRRTPAQRPNTLPTNVKEPPRVAAAVAPRGKRVQTPQPTRTTPPPPAPLVAPLPAQPQDQSFALAHAAKGVEALGVLVQYLVFRLDALNGGAWRQEAERWRSVAAAEHSSAARADRDRQQRAQKDLDTIAECLSKISELEMEVSSKEEINARLQATHIEEVAALADDIKGLKDTIDSLKREVAESRTRLHAHSEIERTLRAQLEAARKETQRQNHRRPDTSCDKAVEMMCDKSCDTSCDMSCNMCDAACDPVVCEAEECELRLSEELSTDANELAAEVRSLRAVIELKQAEMASLRDTRTELTAERERRAALERESRAARHAAEELRERAAARQREADRLKDELRRLRDAAARDRDHATRLAALNEELRYKLRQKSQVVSLLAGSGYIESHRGMRARTSSGDSGRSASPPPDSPPSPASSPAPDSPPLPAVKGVVEKHDSVSWVLEIEETPEEVASRLARKSSFRNGASQSGVKRRGGGSPGSTPAPASPAPNASKLFRPGDIDFPPAPPPLKESAGEAIYIYDDRQY